jgi:hypothetical protein
LYLNKQFRAKIRNKDTVRSTHKMLAYVLALVVGLGSFAIYMAAFFFPEVHRKEDFAWSAVGLFYALVLWVCAGRITGGVLLGQMASVALLGWFGWQTLTLRRELIPSEQQTPVPSQGELTEKLKNISPSGQPQGLLNQVTGFFKSRSKSTPETQTTQPPAEARASSPIVTVVDKTTPQTDSTPKEANTPVAEVAEVNPVEEEPATADTEMSESPELVRPNPPDPELVEAAQNSATSEAPHSSTEAVTPIEEIIPEVELAPPAEPPGPGDPEDRLAESETTASIEAVPIDPENPPTAT